MIQANELRIGNLVIVMGKISKIFSIGVNNFHSESNDNTFGFSIKDEDIEQWQANMELLGNIYISPIPITEEWLLKAGFEPRTEYGVKLKDFVDMSNIKYELLELKKSNFKFLFQTNFSKGTIPFFLGVNRMDSLPFNLEYVHQLQNLYFALTGEELTIKQ